MNLKVRLAIMNFLEFAAWGAYLTSMGTYLVNIGMASQIGWFYAIQGVVSIFMPALMGIVADRWIPAQRLLGMCQDRKSTRLNSSHANISYAVFCLKKKKI